MEIKAIVSTFGQSKYNRQTFSRSEQFSNALQTLAKGKAAGEIWNSEFQDAKYWISQACDHAQHESAHEAHDWKPNGGGVVFYDDARKDIGSAYSMNQAAKLAQRLRKLDLALITQEIFHYIDVLEEIAALYVYLQSFKPIIKKGRRPKEKTPEQIQDETFNTGICAICAQRQKLDDTVRMVMHGYEMSDYNHAGYRMGKCFGVGYKPYELSNEANVAFTPVLQNRYKDTSSAIQTLESGKITKVIVTREKWENHCRKEYELTLTAADNPIEFKKEMDERLARLQAKLFDINLDIQINNGKIEKWVFQPLAYGSKGKV